MKLNELKERYQNYRVKVALNTAKRTKGNYAEKREKLFRTFNSSLWDYYYNEAREDCKSNTEWNEKFLGCKYLAHYQDFYTQVPVVILLSTTAISAVTMGDLQIAEIAGITAFSSVPYFINKRNLNYRIKNLHEKEYEIWTETAMNQ